jgi:hypothetical protein
MQVEVSGNFKATIVLKKCAATCSEAFFRKNTNDRKKGQANREVCSVLQKQQKEGDSVLVPRM